MPTAAQPGSAETTTGTPLSAAAPVPPATNAAAGTAAHNRLEAQRRFMLLMAEAEELAPMVHWATLQTAAARLDNLATAQAATWRSVLQDSAETESPDASPLPVEHLSFENVPMHSADDARSEAGSFGSVDGDSQRGDAVQESPLPDDGIGPLDFDERLYPGGPVADSVNPSFAHDDAREDADTRCGACDGDGGGGDGAEGDDDDGDAKPRDPRLGSWCRRDSVGLGQHGRRMYCDYHDLHGGCADACMARDMLQQRRINTLVDKQQKRRRKRPRDDPDGREARHTCYKAVIAWQWANPLGAENRVRLPECVPVKVRRLFPNPICGEGCDFSLRCEKKGHYTGFRTAEESRAIREGFFQGEDLT